MYSIIGSLFRRTVQPAAERSAEEVVMDAGLLAREAGELHRLVSDLNG